MSAPYKPTEEEVKERLVDLVWEYKQVITEINSLGEPAGSRPPLVSTQRRIVSHWERYSE